MSGQGSVGGSSAGPGSARNNGSVNAAKRSLSRRKLTSESGSIRRSSSLSKSTGERTVKKLRLSKALTIPDGTTVADACRRMATRRVDAALLTDSSALLCGIITDKDVATRVIAEGLRPEDTPVSRVMTRNPVFVMSETSAVDALQKMVQGKFRHLPVVENGEVMALLDITKCLYDAIARMERAAEKGNAIAAAVEDVERQWGNGMGAPSTMIETLRERMYRPTVGSLITEGAKIATVVPSDSVFTAAQKMRDFRVSSIVVTSSNKPRGILTSKDILLHVVAPGLSPEITTVDKVMTPNPECASPETTIVDALHTMHDGKFLHLPVVNQDGQIIACLDVLQLTHGAVATVGNAGDSSDISSTMMQKFWDSAFAMEPPEDDEDTRSNFSATMTSDVFGSEAGRPAFSLAGPPNSFPFKLKDRSGRVHRFNCGTESLTELMSAIVQRLGDDIDRTKVPQVMYEDDEGDRVLLSSDSDLIAAVSFARTTNLKGLRLYLDYSNSEIPTDPVKLVSTTSGLQTVLIGCTVAVIGVGLILYLRRANPGFVSKLL